MSGVSRIRRSQRHPSGEAVYPLTRSRCVTRQAEPNKNRSGAGRPRTSDRRIMSPFHRPHRRAASASKLLLTSASCSGRFPSDSHRFRVRRGTDAGQIVLTNDHNDHGQISHSRSGASHLPCSRGRRRLLLIPTPSTTEKSVDRTAPFGPEAVGNGPEPLRRAGAIQASAKPIASYSQRAASLRTESERSRMRWVIRAERLAHAHRSESLRRLTPSDKKRLGPVRTRTT
jgi:hypothetical protein